MGDPFPVSALHGRGTGDLLDAVVELLPPPLPSEEQEEAAAAAARMGPGGTPRVAIIGRPNVGKSTLFNKLLGEERSVVHDMPGTTRDAIDTVVETPDGPVCFIDTAGLRRPARTERGTEHHSVLRALRALERADIAVLVIDATVGASHQDQRLAERIAAGLRVDPTRRATKPTKGSQVRRVEAKRQRSEVKRRRRPPGDGDD